jgi:hypothetical protein
MQDNTWIGIAGSSGQRIVDCLPSPTVVAATQANYSPSNNPNSITSAWCGGSVDQRRGEYLLVANGGHADYAGNEGYALSLRETTPAWRRISDPSPNATLNATTLGSEGNGLYADGRPRSMHNTFQCFGDGRVWVALMNSVASGGGGSTNRVVSYDRDALGAATSPLAWTDSNLGPWTIHGTVAPGDLTSYIFGVSAFDRIGHKVWGLGGNSANNTVFWSIDTIGPSRGTITLYNTNQSFGHWGGWVCVAHDLRILVAGDHLRQTICVLNLNTVASSPSTAWQQVSNVSGTGYFGSGAGGVYVARNRTIGIGNPVSLGRTIYRLQIPTTISNGRVVYNSSGQWVWSNSTPSGPTMVVASGNSGAYTKWNIVEDMGDGRSAIVYLGDINQATYIYKIPAAGL